MCFKMFNIVHFNILEKSFIVRDTFIDNSGKFMSVMFLRIIEFAETLWGKSDELNFICDF